MLDSLFRGLIHIAPVCLMTTSKHCIIYSYENSQSRQSAVILNEKFILTPAAILCGIIESNPYIKKLLETFRIVDVDKDSKLNNVNHKTFTVIHSESNGQNLKKSQATIKYIFNCWNVSDALHRILKNFSPNVLLECSRPKENITEDDAKLISSSFVILKINNQLDARHKLEKTEVSSLNSNSDIRKLDLIYSETTPFGNESFFRTINVGHISNVIGNNGCVLVASMPLVYGSEGGAVYNRTGDLIGMVISTEFSWKGENATLTLVARLTEIFRELLRQMNKKNQSPKTIDIDRHSYTEVDRNIVLIGNSSAWGTGCFVKIFDEKWIITCAHVVASSLEVSCTWMNGTFTSKVIYKNPNFNKPFDIALLSVPPHIPDDFFANCYEEKPKLGQRILAVGFPHFSTLATLNFSPSIYDGRISKLAKGMFMTDASVQAGQSGGPVFTNCGKLIGVSVSNSKDHSRDQIYPRLNMVVPIFEIYPILKRFATSKDFNILNELVANREIQSIWSLDVPYINSKL